VEVYSKTDFRVLPTSLYRKMKSSPDGIDPKGTFMNGTLNVGTSFMLNEKLDFNDPEQKKVMAWIDHMFDNLVTLFAIGLYHQLFPDWMIKRDLPRKLVSLFSKNLYSVRDVIWGEFYPFIIHKIKQHEDNLDEENPRDYVDYLILENRKNADIGYHSIAGSILHLYLGAGDTLTNTMRWLCIILSLHPEVQTKCHAELEKCYDENQFYLEKECPFVCATLEEVFRFRPVGDTLPHYTSKDISFQGRTIPKKTVITASLTAIMHDPKHFNHPEKFNPSRFIKNGKFSRDPRVCVFSTGLRNCVGKKLAQQEFFSFAAHTLHKFRLEHAQGKLDKNFQQELVF